MSIQPTFFDWTRSGLNFNAPPYESCSPNLLCLVTPRGTGYLQQRWPGGQYLGCEGDRATRLGTSQSEHSWGAATDWRYPQGTSSEILAFLINNSAELGVCGIHDYVRSRIWRAGRTSNLNDAHTRWWKYQSKSATGMGQAWADYFHIVTTKQAWGWTKPIQQRLGQQPLPLPPPDAPPAPNPPPTPPTYKKRIIDMYQVRYTQFGWPGSFIAKVTADAIHHAQNGDAANVDTNIGGVPNVNIDRVPMVQLLMDRGRRHVSMDDGGNNTGNPFTGAYADAELSAWWLRYQR